MTRERQNKCRQVSAGCEHWQGRRVRVPKNMMRNNEAEWGVSSEWICSNFLALKTVHQWRSSIPWLEAQICGNVWVVITCASEPGRWGMALLGKWGVDPGWDGFLGGWGWGDGSRLSCFRCSHAGSTFSSLSFLETSGDWELLGLDSTSCPPSSVWTPLKKHRQ